MATKVMTRTMATTLIAEKLTKQADNRKLTLRRRLPAGASALRGYAIEYAAAFRSALETRSVMQAELAMREMGRVGLLDALD
jgi:hypothetical protein